jgi:uncharacterized membrane protein
MVTVTPRAAKWLIAFFCLSLAANVFVGGLYAGTWLGRGSSREEKADAAEDAGAPDRPGQALLRRIIASVPEAERPGFVAALAPHRPAIAEAGRTLRGARLRARDAIAAKPFAREALDAAFAEVRQRTGELQAAMHDAMAQAIEGLTPEARAAVLMRLQAGAAQ